LIALIPQAWSQGKALYEGAGGCAACHMPDGQGQPGVIPPLADSPWVFENPERLIAISLKGMEGPIRVKGKTYFGVMPPQLLFNDQQMADILNYVGSSWSNRSEAITADQVARVRKKWEKKVIWSVKDVVKTYPFADAWKKDNGDGGAGIKDMLTVTDKPLVVRTFMPGASPAAIAVGLPGAQHYCWDAGECRLRYVWSKGSFLINNRVHWSSNGKPVASFIGEPYYRARNSLISEDELRDRNQTNVRNPAYDTSEAVDFPIRFGSGEQPLPQFRGYRLIEEHPEFWCRVGEVDIRELIRVTADGKGIVRRFVISGHRQPVTVTLASPPTAKITTSAGVFSEGTLQLTAQEAEAFTITIKEAE
ncbi:MAG: cytochrome c, partial [Verrucomicrobiota bacterium]